MYWRIRACLRQGGLSRNKVSVGEPADGSPPMKPGGRSQKWLLSPTLFFDVTEEYTVTADYLTSDFNIIWRNNSLLPDFSLQNHDETSVTSGCLCTLWWKTFTHAATFPTNRTHPVQSLDEPCSVFILYSSTVYSHFVMRWPESNHSS